MDETTHICPWCSTPIPPGAKACSKCGALVEGAVATDIPGVTVVDPEATLGPKPGVVPNPLSWLRAGSDDGVTDEAAFQPPSEAVRLEMRKIELETQIENAGTEVMDPTGDESLDAGEPSDEAIAAAEAGQLDETGPAGETDLAELAGPWEDPELENRVSLWRKEGDEER
ncbi:MAG: zinc-ribbon domain-containing protein [Candidatus Limnocylindrales bacterium]